MRERGASEGIGPKKQKKFKQGLGGGRERVFGLAEK